MNFHAQQKLGRLPSLKDPRNLDLSNYLTPPPAANPPSLDWSKVITDWPAAGNDRWGDCVFATASHLIHLWSENTGDPRIIPDSEVVRTYLDYSPRDTGYNILDRLKLWTNRGLWSTKLWCFTEVDLHNRELVRSAIHLFGGIDVGVNLPIAWQGSELWTTGKGYRFQPGSWGGHSVPIVAYSPDYLLAVTWGDTVRLTWSALETYCDEAYALIDPLWLRPSGETPSGFDLVALRTDLHAATR